MANEPVFTTLESTATTKPWWKSKTVLLNVLALLALTVPAVAQWLKANPVEAAAVLSAVNLLVRFATQGKVTIFSDDESGNGSADTGVGGNATGDVRGAGPGGDYKQRASGFPWLVVSACAACGFLTSCGSAWVQTLKELPITIGIEGEHGTYGYNPETGLNIAVKVREEKSATFKRRPDGEAVAPNPHRRFRPRAMCLDGFQGERGEPMKDVAPVTSPAL